MNINNLISPDNSTNPKRLYGYIKNQRNDQSGIHQLQDKDGFIRSDSLTKANILKQDFQSVFTQNEDISTIPDKGISPHPIMLEDAIRRLTMRDDTRVMDGLKHTVHYPLMKWAEIFYTVGSYDSVSISHPAVDGLQSTCLFEPSGCQFIGIPNAHWSRF